MLKVGLTGGIGCGKSTAVQRFRELGVPVIEADLIAREVVAIGQPALQEIAGLFGTQALQVDGALDRAWLRQTVFSDPVRLQQLESILHPRIRADILSKIAACSDSAYVIVDVPLLFEKGYTQLFERILVIDCQPDQQRTRVQQRDGSDDAVITSIMQSQLGRETRLQQANDIISNTSSITDFYEKIDDLNNQYLRISNA
ncbi:dephospho-CoA kinase [Thiothrix fructosivorans]|jgi:dephospho-CoA kinase|uniref:Dephospho-CoA kinase n=1 Tax=Thiothrix fructosivorans TaxID=111770 RepID=A0A8B0SR31_9GAMM|nr:dephospho-CoA kinase [Thiothrix fructosivorans]MBO0613198.1 dephospho-CoA kinase [Thiothrix fructosivorans]QTX11362.1 dephospho-CoA kinase [Thiothrix fructosivorans]